MKELNLIITRFASDTYDVDFNANFNSNASDLANSVDVITDRVDNLAAEIDMLNRGVEALANKNQLLLPAVDLVKSLNLRTNVNQPMQELQSLISNGPINKFITGDLQQMSKALVNINNNTGLPKWKEQMEELSQLDLGKINSSGLTRTKNQLQEILNMINKVQQSDSKGNLAGLFTAFEGTGLISTLPSSTRATLEAFGKLDELAKNDSQSLSTLKHILEQSVTTIDSVGGSVKSLTEDEKQENAEVDKNIEKHEKQGNTLSNLGMKYTELLSKIRLYIGSIRRLTSFFGSMVTQSSDMIESINLYKMALGDLASNSMANWQDAINKLYLDPKEVYQYSGQFYNLAKGLGVAAEDAAFMSKNLAQLTFDMTSYLNLSSNDIAFDKLQSAMSGQTKAVTNVGIAVQKASLDQLAYELGIEKTVSEMTQAEKTYLRYIQIMRSTTQMQGDLGRTIITPTNAMRLARTQAILFARAIGQVLTPIIMKLLPVVIAVTQLLTEFAQTLAKALGFDLKDYEADTTGLFGNLSDGADDANDSIGKLNRTLAKFDDLNVVENASSGAGAGVTDTIDFSKYLNGYDMLKNYTDKIQTQIENIKTKIKNLMPVIKTVIGLVVGSFVVSTLTKIIGKIIDIKDKIGLVWTAIKNSKLVTGIGSLAKAIAEKIGLSGTSKKDLDDLKENINKTKEVNEATNSASKTFSLPSWGTLIKGIGQIALVVSAFAALAMVLYGANELTDGSLLKGLDVIKEMAIALAIAIVPFGALAAGCIAIAPLWEALLGGLGAIAAFVGAAGIMVTAVGALMQLPYIEEFLDKGIETLIKLSDGIGRIIGSFVGGIIGGVSEGIFASLEKIGKDLSKFSEAIKPFIENMSLVDDSVADKSDKIASAILKFTAASFIAGIPILNAEMLAGMISIGIGLSAFAPYMKDYAKTLSEVSVDDVDKTVHLTNAISEFAKAAPRWGGLKGWINGEVDLYKLGSQLAGFGGKMYDYSGHMKGVDLNIVEKSIAAAKSIAEFADLSPRYNGLKQMLGGGVDLWKFGEQLSGFGRNFAMYYTNARMVDTNIVEKSAAAAKSLAEFADLSPKYGGLKNMFSGEQNLWTFGQQLAGFGGKFWDYSNHVSGVNFNAVDKSIESLDELVTIAKKIYENKLYDAIGKFGDKLTNAGTGLANFFSKANGKSLGTQFGQNVADGIEEGIKKNLKTSIKLTDTSGLFGNKTVSTFSVKAYEKGGYPKSADMFFMNENGRAEYMTSIGNKTAVVNQDQMTTALADTITRALGSINTNSQQGDVVVYIGNEKVYQGQGEYQSRQSDRYGTTYVKI